MGKTSNLPLNTTEMEDKISEFVSEYNDNMNKLDDKVSSAVSEAQSASSTANQAKETANGISGQVQSANETAASALSTAQSAEAVAGNAKTAAQTAVEEADKAQKSAGEAKRAAESAGQKADNAATTATNAATAAQEAAASAASAKGSAESSQAEIEAALTTANEAKASAQTASQDAKEAKTTASSALSTAGTALSDADAAKKAAAATEQKAIDAVETAKLAKTTAESAKTTANAASNNIDEAKAISEDAYRKASAAQNTAQSADDKSTSALSASANNRDEIYAANNEISGLKRDIQTLQAQVSTKIDGFKEVDEGLWNALSDGVVVDGPYPFGRGGSGSGGGGSVSHSVCSIKSVSQWNSKTIAYGDSCPVTVHLESLEDEMPTGKVTLKVYINGALRINRDESQGDVTVDLGPYLQDGSNPVRIMATDVYGASDYITKSVSTVNVGLVSSFDASVTQSGAVNYTFIPYGEIEKVIHFELDGREIDTMVTSVSGRQLTYTIPSQNYGAHSFRVWITCDIDGNEIRSNELYNEIMFVREGETRKIISSDFVEQTVSQYSNVVVNFSVYDPTSLTAEAVITINGDVASRQTVGRGTQTFSFRADFVGENVIVISSGEESKTLPVLTVTESDIDIEAETENLSLYLTSIGRSNSEDNPGSWTFGDIEATFSNFNYKSNGWVLDDDNFSVLRVNGNSRVSIPYKPFAKDIRANGFTFEMQFKVRDVLVKDSVLFSCMQGNKGIQITTNNVLMKSEQSELSRPFNDEELIRVSFVVEKRSGSRLFSMWINGIIQAITAYPASDDFEQANPVYITIGSNGAGIDIYDIRVYDNDLNRQQMVTNFVADIRDVDKMIDAYNRNNIYDAYGNVVIDKLPKTLPYLVKVCDELPQFKGDKKVISGRFVNPSKASSNFEFENASDDVQGTSSQGYPGKNYKTKFDGGFRRSNGVVDESFQLRSNSIPTKTYTFKKDFASSESVNNIGAARLYNDFVPYKTPAQIEDDRIRQSIDGIPIVVFWDNGEKVRFLGKYNFNNDKGTPEVYGFEDGVESWEVKNNTSNKTLFIEGGIASSKWGDDFEAAYPEDNEDVSGLDEFVTWVASTNPENATEKALDEPVIYSGVEYSSDTAEYRLAKFKAELPEFAEVKALLFYYWFTDVLLAVDSRAKNMFPTRWYKRGGKWYIRAYDLDTILGINNEGALVFDYWLEDTDLVNGAYVYNGQTSVLWNNIRKCYPDEIAVIAQNAYSNGFNYDTLSHYFDDHQDTWPEAIFNEDTYECYIRPYVEEGVDYLYAAQGDKRSQRHYFLRQRLRYNQSKNVAGEALSSFITIRAYEKGDISITPYYAIYASVKYAQSKPEQVRCMEGETVTVPCPLDTMNDTEVTVYSANQIESIGDISPLKPGLVDISKAENLQSLKAGDSSSSYSNPNLTRLFFGNNKKLRVVDVRNCPNLGTGETKSPDMSNCRNIEEIYFDGTSITGLSLADGAPLRILKLPGTVSNLTLKNLTALTSFTMGGYSNLTTVDLENNSSAVNSLTIFNALSGGTRLRLIGIDWTITGNTQTFIDKLESMRGMDEQGNNTALAQISGKIKFSTITSAQMELLRAHYPDIEFTYTTIQYTVNYYNEDGSQLYKTSLVNSGGTAGTYTPTKSSTPQYSYSFSGWSLSPGGAVDNNARSNVTADRNIYAVFTSSLRTYTVTFVNGSTTLQTVNNVPYGGSAAYTGSEPTQTGKKFKGWSPEPTNIVANTTCYAQFGAAIDASITDISALEASLATKTYASEYSTGDTIVFDLGTETVALEIVAFDRDKKADGTVIPITWGLKYIMNSSRRMNPARATADDGSYVEGTGTVGGYAKSEMYKYLNETVLPLLPQWLRDHMVPAVKYTRNYDTTGSVVNNVESEELICPFSRYEIFGSSVSDAETMGVTYSDYFNSTDIRKKTKVSSTSANYWWERSAYDTYFFAMVSYNGSSYYSNAYNSYGVVFSIFTS